MAGMIFMAFLLLFGGVGGVIVMVARNWKLGWKAGLVSTIAVIAAVTVAIWLK